MNFNYNKIMKPKTTVHCKNEEQANLLLQWANSKGLKWCTNKSYLNDNNWSYFGSGTCYNLYEGCFDCYNNYLIYLQTKNYKIYSFEDVVLKKKKRRIKPLIKESK